MNQRKLYKDDGSCIDGVMPKPTYFTGNNVKGKVSALKGVHTFDHFVRALIAEPVLLNFERSVFLSLPKEERNAAKQVPYFTPAAFKEDHCARLYENATHAYLVVIDIDDSDQARPLISNTDVFAKQLHPYGFAAYHTASSTPDNPRLRVIVKADLAIPDYRAGVLTVAKLLGLPELTRESFVPVQAMFRPTMFAEDDPLDHPLLSWQDGQALAAKDFLDDLENMSRNTRTEAAVDANPEDVDHVRPRVDDVTLADVEEALQHLDPDSTYQEWLDVAAALKHQYDSQEAYELFDSWSSKGKKYKSPQDTRAKWDSLKVHPVGRAPVTIRTVLFRATEEGWNNSKMTAKGYQNVLKWINNYESLEPHTIMSEGPMRIAAVPMLSPLEQGDLLSRLQRALKAKDIKVSRAELQKALKACAPKKPEDSKPKLPPWARGFVYVAGANEFFHRVANRRFSPEVMDNVFSVKLPLGENGRPVQRPRDYLLNECTITRVDHYRYDPGSPHDAIVREDGKTFVNSYVATHPPPSAKRAVAAGKVLEEHVRTLIAEEEYQQLLLSFLAYHVQHPGRKIRWATLLQGAQGCGKTAFADLMRVVLGQQHVSTLDATLLYNSAFNEWATDAQLVAVEEVRVIGHNRHETMNRLKPCITNATISVNRKNKSLQVVPNVTNYIMFTNHHDALALQDGDRRYFVLECQLQRRDQVLSLPKNYFTKLYDTFECEGEGLRSYFENFPLADEFNPDGYAPATTYFSNMVTISATPLSAAVRETLGDHPLVSTDLVSMRYLRQMLELQEGLPNFTDQTLSVVLREEGYEPAGRVRLGDDGERHRLWARGTVEDPIASAKARYRSGEFPKEEHDTTINEELL